MLDILREIAIGLLRTHFLPLLLHALQSMLHSLVATLDDIIESHYPVPPQHFGPNPPPVPPPPPSHNQHAAQTQPVEGHFEGEEERSDKLAGNAQNVVSRRTQSVPPVN